MTRVLQRLEQERLEELSSPLSRNCPISYIDGNTLGFNLLRPTPASAFKRLALQVEKLALSCAESRFGVFKTHDVAPKDFATLAELMPQLRIVTLRRDFKDVVVSRYFYCRYYWHTEPALGDPPRMVTQMFAATAGFSDVAALKTLLRLPLIRAWAREWSAFEMDFAHQRAIRVDYEQLLDGSDWARIAGFVGHGLPHAEPFAAEQALETQNSGRTGKTRFNRQGTAGQWQNWFDENDAAHLDALARSAVERAKRASRLNPTRSAARSASRRQEAAH
jgi:hypothetical protein